MDRGLVAQSAHNNQNGTESLRGVHVVRRLESNTMLQQHEILRRHLCSTFGRF